MEAETHSEWWTRRPACRSASSPDSSAVSSWSDGDQNSAETKPIRLENHVDVRSMHHQFLAFDSIRNGLVNCEAIHVKALFLSAFNNTIFAYSIPPSRVSIRQQKPSTRRTILIFTHTRHDTRLHMRARTHQRKEHAPATWVTRSPPICCPRASRSDARFWVSGWVCLCVCVCVVASQGPLVLASGELERYVSHGNEWRGAVSVFLFERLQERFASDSVSWWAFFDACR